MEITVVETNAVRAQYQTCPSCKATIEVDPRYPVWCECGWNIRPQQMQARNVFDRIYASVSTKAGRSLLNEVLHRQSLRPAFTPGMVLAAIIALCVHGVVVLMAVAGIAVIIAGWPSLYLVVLGGTLLVVAWFFRPRLVPPPATVLSRESFPELYALVDRIADGLDSPHVDGLVVTGAFNASFARVGWRRRRIISIGLPLWSILTPQERVAIIGHELGHGINGDWLRSFLIGGAVNILLTWYVLVDPAGASPQVRGALGFGYDLGILLLYPIRLMIKALSFVLASLLWRSSQRAEYLADYLGATASGSAAALSALNKLHQGWNFNIMVDVILNERQGAFLPEFQRRFAAIPPRELERVKRIEQLESTRLDATHPPTAYRIEFLSTRWLEPQVVFSKSESDRIDQELKTLTPSAERAIAYRFGRL